MKNSTKKILYILLGGLILTGLIKHELIMDLANSVVLGLDILAPLSIIIAVFVFINSNKQENEKSRSKAIIENKKHMQNKKVAEILDLLKQFRDEHFDVFSKEINNDDKAPNPGPILTDMAEFLRVKMLPTFAIFATKTSIDELVDMMIETDEAIDIWDVFCGKDKDKDAHNKVSKGMNKYMDSMKELDVQLTENLRKQVHSETEEEIKEITKIYKERKYTYRKVKFI